MLTTGHQNSSGFFTDQSLQSDRCARNGVRSSRHRDRSSVEPGLEPFNREVARGDQGYGSIDLWDSCTCLLDYRCHGIMAARASRGIRRSYERIENGIEHKLFPPDTVIEVRSATGAPCESFRSFETSTLDVYADPIYGHVDCIWHAVSVGLPWQVAAARFAARSLTCFKFCFVSSPSAGRNRHGRDHPHVAFCHWPVQLRDTKMSGMPKDSLFNGSTSQPR